MWARRGSHGCDKEPEKVEHTVSIADLGSPKVLPPHSRTRDGQKAYGVPSQCNAGVYYMVDSQSCTCVDFKRHRLSGARVGRTGAHRPCKHILAAVSTASS